MKREETKCAYRCSLGVYRAVAWVVSKILSWLGPEVWARNSVRLGGVVPFLSDIDLTIYCHELSFHRVRWIAGIYARLRQMAPILGEANFYPGRWRDFILKNANPYELARDPRLLQKHPVTVGRSPDRVAAAVFACRMFQSDLRNLRDRPHRRAFKWRLHLEQLALPDVVPPLTAAKLIDSLNDHLFAQLTDLPVWEVLNEIVRSPDVDQAMIDQHLRGARYSHALLLLFPIQWLTICNRRAELGPAVARLHGLKDSELEWVACQMQWELAGAGNQLMALLDDASCAAHLRNVLLLLELSAPEMHRDVLAEIKAIGLYEVETPASLISPTYCARAWFALEIGTAGEINLCQYVRTSYRLGDGPLAEVLNSPEVSQVRARILQGGQPEVCRPCFEVESAGGRSLRQISNDVFARGFDPTELIAPKALRVAVDVTNARWFGNESLRNTMVSGLNGTRELEFSGGNAVNFAGHADILRSLIAAGKSPKMRLVYRSNGLVDPSDLFGLWQNFERVDFVVGINGPPSMEAYFRLPAQCAQILKVLARIDESPSFVRAFVSISVHALNVSQIPEIALWLLTQQYKKINLESPLGCPPMEIQEHPGFLAIAACPLGLKSLAISELRSAAKNGLLLPQDVELIIHRMRMENSYDSQKTPNRLQALDRMLGANFASAFPRSAPFYLP